MFFFFFYVEKRIGIKKLTDADLGFSAKSNQTHIGLYSEVLTYLDDSDVVKSAMLVYENSCEILDCIFDRIENPDGTFRSPKIRKGNDGNSVVEKIRLIASKDKSADWYLVWSGMESQQLYFWLFDNKSNDFNMVCDALSSKLSGVLTDDDTSYAKIKYLFEQKINNVSISIQKDIEVASQIGNNNRIYKHSDIEKAQQLFNKIGKEGESLIAEYLEREKLAKKISSYRWMNKNHESGEPFDFIIDEHLSSENFIDVKSTRFDFNHHIFFSDSEAQFINDLSQYKKYSVYRLFEMDQEEKKLRVCDNCISYMQLIQKNIQEFSSVMSDHHALLQSIKFGVKPNDCFVSINNTIIL